MGKHHRNRRSTRASLPPARAGVGAPASTWGWRGGVSTGAGGFSGEKLRGTLRSAYPSGYDLDATALRARSRIAYWDSPQARALIQRLVDNVIGTDLTIRSSPAWELIGSTLDDEGRRRQSDEIDVRFKLWANSHEPDATGRRTLAELLGFSFSNELRDGDLPIILRYSGDSSRISPLNLQILDADQIDTRQTSHAGAPTAGLALDAQARGNLLRDGLELTSAGALAAIYVLDPAKPWGPPTRVPVRGSSGRRFVLLPSLLDLPGQVRGVGILAALIHELQKITDYTVAEIEAALINAVVAAVIQPATANDTRSKAEQILGAEADPSANAETTQNISKTGIVVDRLKAGETLGSYNTTRPNVNFGQFVDVIVKYLSASLSMPVEVLEMKFSTSYSSARAALLQFWQVVKRWRVHVVSQILMPIFEAWLSEEVAAGRLPALVANGFTSDPVRRRAWLQADVIGDPMPSLDPLKDVNAVKERQTLGHTSGEREALEYNRSDIYDNAVRLKREKDALPQAPSPAIAPAPGKTDDKDDNEDQPEKEGVA